MTSIKEFFVKNALYLALIQAIIATLGSLYFSEIRHFTPCVLCWYQRIGMYPLVLALLVGILRKDSKVYQYVLPPAIWGWCIALYHNFLYYKWLPWSVEPCSSGVSCTSKFIEYGGFITIPLLAFVAFTVIIALMLVQRNTVRKQIIV